MRSTYGGWPTCWARACCCASKTTTGSVAARNTRPAILEDLDWLGFEPENAVTPDYRQSDSDAVYREALGRLRRGHNVYRCVCTRKDLAAHCPQAKRANASTRGAAARRTIRAAPLTACGWNGAAGEESFEDGFLGPRKQEPARQCGDLLLRDRHGQWTYQFAVAVDDMRHGVNLIVRGEDLLDSTGRQIRLARLLGRAAPARFYHHPLVTDAAGRQARQEAALARVGGTARGRHPAGESLGEAARMVGLPVEARPLERLEIAATIAARHGMA